GLCGTWRRPPPLLCIGARGDRSHSRAAAKSQEHAMARMLTVGAAQLGPIQRADSRANVVRRRRELLRRAASHGCQLVVFPELALTTFFPRWWMTDQEEIDSFFEREMPSNETAPLFNEAQRLALGVCLGYAELGEENAAMRPFNTSV